MYLTWSKTGSASCLIWGSLLPNFLPSSKTNPICFHWNKAWAGTEGLVRENKQVCGWWSQPAYLVTTHECRSRLYVYLNIIPHRVKPCTTLSQHIWGFGCTLMDARGYGAQQTASQIKNKWAGRVEYIVVTIHIKHGSYIHLIGT